MSAHKPIDVCRDAINQAGIPYAGEIVADGLRHRFKPEGDPGDNGIYQVWEDDHPAGWAKDYKRDVYVTWSGKKWRRADRARTTRLARAPVGY